MRALGDRFVWGLREAAWQVDEKVVWPATDAIQYVPGRDGMPPSERESWWGRHAVDLAIAAGLAVVGFLLRRHGLPTDGLWLDDSIVGAGLHASVHDLLPVSADHPGYQAALIGWNELTGGDDATLAYPTLAAGALGPAALYLALRFCGYERSIGLLMGAALAVAATDVVYSGRLKTYTIDILIVLALALVIPRLTQIRWRWWTGIAWVVGAGLLAFFSGFLLIAVGVAGAIVLLHPTSDLRIRVPAVAVQEAICVALLAAENRTHDVATQQDKFRELWDVFPDFSTNPITFATDSFVHFRRVAEYLVGGPAWFSGLCIVVAVAGLVVAAWRGNQAVRARYLLLLLMTVFVAGLFGKFPFGPRQSYLISSGGRVSLWLIPVVAIGLAAALQGLRGVLPGRIPRVVFDVAACVAAVVVVVVGFNRDPVEYPFPGAHSATEFVDSQLGPRDAVLVGYRSDWSFAAESDLSAGIERTPDRSVGFQPDFHDPRIHRVDAFTDVQHVGPEVSQADRVLVYYAEHPFSDSEQQLRTQLASSLAVLGFRPRPTRTFDDATVQIWRRPGTATRPGNLAVTDLPAGWRAIGHMRPAPGTRMLRCAGVVPSGRPNVVALTGPNQLNAISQVNQWKGVAAVSRASSALRRSRGASCVRSTIAKTLSAVGLPLTVGVTPQRPPAGAGRGAVAYRVSARDRTGGTSGAAGSVVFLSRGAKSGLLIGLRGDGMKAFPQALMADLISTLAQRVQAESP